MSAQARIFTFMNCFVMTGRLLLCGVLFCFGMESSAQTPGQIFRSAEPAGAAILDPNGDGWITSSGATYSDTALLVDESAEFEQSWTILWHYENEPSSDLQTGSDCGPTELVDNYKTGQHAAYYRIIDPDNVDGNGDEMLAFRIRVNKDPNNAAYGYSFLLDTDGKFGASGPNQDLDYLAGNPGFEYEILFASGNSGGVEVNDVNGVAAGNAVTTLVSYGDGVRDQRSYAIFTNCEDPSNTSENPIFIDFYINFSSLGGGVTSQTSLRMVFASASSANTALGGSASDIGGVNDSNYPDDDSIFEVYIDNVPQFSFSSGYAADNTPPTITSAATGTDLAENSGAGQTIYTITATDDVAVTSYAIAGTDAGLLSVNAASGVVTLVADPNYETKSSYSFNVTASDAATNTSAATTVTFSITNVDEVIPTITSGATGTNLAENSGATQTIYTIAADANDGGTIQSYAIGGTDVSLLSVNSSTGVVTLTANPNYETKSSYSFTVTATDETGTSAATTVTFSITNVDEVIPTITSGTTGTNLADNSGSGQTIYTITADANDGGTIQSYAIGGTDLGLLTLTGNAVSLDADPDYDTKSSYSFTVTASDAAGTSAVTTVTFSITNGDGVAPVITSGVTGTDLAENSGAGQTIYTITATDDVAVTSYAIAGTDAGLLSVNAASGVVTLVADPNYETKSSYSFNVTASDAATNTSAATTVTFSITDVVCEDPTACNYGDVSNLACTFATAWYADADGDNLGDASDSQSACTAPSGYVADNTDNCDNTAALNFDAGTYGNVACKLFAVTPTMSACDAAANATLDLSTLHSETGTWTYALDVNISGFASASLVGSTLTIDYSGANTGSGTVELTATDGTNTGDIDVTVTESLYPYVTSFIVDGAATHGSLDGGWQIGFTGAYGAPVTVHYYDAAVFGYSGSSFLGTLGYGTEQTGSTDASGDLLTLPQATYWISGYTNVRGCFNPEPATGPVPTVSPSLRHAPVPTKL